MQLECFIRRLQVHSLLEKEFETRRMQSICGASATSKQLWPTKAYLAVELQNVRANRRAARRSVLSALPVVSHIVQLFSSPALSLMMMVAKAKNRDRPGDEPQHG